MICSHLLHGFDVILILELHKKTCTSMHSLRNWMTSYPFNRHETDHAFLSFKSFNYFCNTIKYPSFQQQHVGCTEQKLSLCGCWHIGRALGFFWLRESYWTRSVWRFSVNHQDTAMRSVNITSTGMFSDLIVFIVIFSSSDEGSYCVNWNFCAPYSAYRWQNCEKVLWKSKAVQIIL